MDFMFEDEVDEVGSDVEAYCPKCKGDTTHVVISKYEDEIRRVQCNPCGDVHSFRKPRGDVEDDVPEPIAAKKRAMMKKHSWDEFFAKHSEKNAKPYEFRERYHDNVIVNHPKFGKGFVSEVVSDSKVEITFKDARRVLVHNRKDMPGLPLAAEGDGRPSNTKIAISSKGAKGKVSAKDAKAAVVKEAPKVVAKSAPVAVAPAAKGKGKVPPAKVAAKTSPAAKPAAAKAKAKPARAVSPAAKPAKASAKPKAKAVAKPSKPAKKAKGKK
jgi:hypothetical protein